MSINSNLIIIAITCLVSILAFNNTRLAQQLILWPPAVSRDHQYYRLVSYGLLHADPQHLLFNMLTLYFFGNDGDAVHALSGTAGLRAVLRRRLDRFDPADLSGNRNNAGYQPRRFWRRRRVVCVHSVAAVGGSSCS